MKSSQLVAIIKRLEAMVEAQDNEVQVRRFEKEGVEKCTVTYDNSTETFELKEAESSQSYQFDNVDIVAMEIYDLIQ
ncbi:YkuJ family protein [Enterococcus entomosocium]|uniref:YkuJ family protein n=1 Tax=Enterococcus entomosocium TaxID=3034352 RepID=UPI003B5AF751